MDEIEQLKKEIWSILMDSNTTKETKILATKELHSLSKTYTLLIKDLPVVTNLSKYYDQDTLNSNYDNFLQSKNSYSNRTNQEIVRDSIQRKNFNKPENLDSPFDPNGDSCGKTLVDESGLNVDNAPNKYKKLDDEIFETMQAQLNH